MEALLAIFSIAPVTLSPRLFVASSILLAMLVAVVVELAILFPVAVSIGAVDSAIRWATLSPLLATASVISCINVEEAASETTLSTVPNPSFPITLVAAKAIPSAAAAPLV